MTVYEAEVRVEYPARTGRYPRYFSGFGEDKDAAIAAAVLEAIRHGELCEGATIEIKNAHYYEYDGSESV